MKTGGVAIWAAVLGVTAVAAEEVSLEKGDGKVTVTIGDALFTEYVFEGAGRSKPILYPVNGPGGVRMVRDYPMKKTEGEASDHPHHASLWYTHGDVNGVSFWHVADDTGTIVNESTEVADGAITSKNSWKDKDGKLQCSDTTVIRFAADEVTRTIDYQVTVEASAGDVKFGDTKEGSMGIRTHPNLRLSNGKGVTTANGKALNSNGDRDKALWGKAAAWVDYWGEIDGKTVGVAIFDHPTNPRHPTTWHARDYGLVAANPFGWSYFKKAEKGAGDLVIKDGESVTWRYRFVFHEGDVTAANVGWLYESFASE